MRELQFLIAFALGELESVGQLLLEVGVEHLLDRVNKAGTVDRECLAAVSANDLV
jgi:hypothetical protein